MMTQATPKVVILPLTYKCNAKCVMCNIWKEKDKQEVDLEKLKSIFSEDILAENIESVNLTGGEPLLRKELVDVIRILASKCKKLSSLTINTNGFYFEKYPELVMAINQIRKEKRNFQLIFYVSLDGPRETHDIIRGKKGFFTRTLKTIRFLKERSEIDNLDISVNCTITPENYQTMMETYQLAAELGVKIDFTYSMESQVYFNNSEQISEINYSQKAKKEIVSTINELLCAGELTYNRSYYRNLLKMIQGKKRVISCIFKNEGFFLHPSGDVYNCWIYDKKIGNVHESTIESIWHSEDADAVREDISSKCELCTNNCYVNFKRNDSIKQLIEGGEKNKNRIYQ